MKSRLLSQQMFDQEVSNVSGPMQQSISDLASRTTLLELSNTQSQSSNTSLLARMAAAENSLSGKASVTALNSLSARVTTNETEITSIKAWRAAKAPASADVPTNVTLPTVAIVGLVSTLTKSGVEAMFNTVMGEVNGIKAVLRSREIMAA